MRRKLERVRAQEPGEEREVEEAGLVEEIGHLEAKMAEWGVELDELDMTVARLEAEATRQVEGVAKLEVELESGAGLQEHRLGDPADPELCWDAHGNDLGD